MPRTDTVGHNAMVARQDILALPNGRSVAYRDFPGPAGAETIVLLHGIGMTADLNWGGSFAALRRRFRVIAPDLPGHGRSVYDSPSFALEDCADDVVALANALGVGRFIVTGYSMGGLVAQLVWRRHPERAARLVLCASSRNFLGTPAERVASMFAPVLTAAVRLNPLLGGLGAGVMNAGLVNDLHGEHRQYALTEMNRTSMTTVAAALVAVSNFTSHDWIGEVDVPVTVLVTTRDTVVPPARQRRLAAAIPHARTVMVDGDHTVCISDPDRFNAKLLEACDNPTRVHGLT
ncbi:alpha/beta fold hydrolase [Mycolicibacterium holsaticum]|uniref:alpha/beta fold hydrolase n=1 Tax=Mycolicibacterium holsaticum TaxID=152142 RepID=UPI001041E4D6|nr:alpha/beta hydrolase [Mycolicibacterium holsaticum]